MMSYNVSSHKNARGLKMTPAHKGVKRLAMDHPDWIPVVKASLKCAKRYRGEFAGKWVLNELNKTNWPGLKYGNTKAKWFPGLRLLKVYGILERKDVTRGGRRAYYTMPDAKGVEKALGEIPKLR